MTRHAVIALRPGVYVILWRAGGTSIAAVGVTADGGRWLAPLNWIEPTVDQAWWRKVSAATLVPRVSLRCFEEAGA